MDWTKPWSERYIDISVREIMSMSISDIWDIEPGRYNVTFDNGEVISSSRRRIIIDRHLWQMFEHVGVKGTPEGNGQWLTVAGGPPLFITNELWEKYQALPNVSITPCCSINTVMGNNPLNGSTHIKTINNCFIEIIKSLGLRWYRDKEYLLEKVIRVTGSYYNDVIINLGAFITTIDATDLVDFLHIPEIVEIKSRIENHPDSIDAAHKALTRFVMTTDNKNNLILPNRSGAIRNSLFNQGITRGFVSDIDRTVFSDAVLEGYFRGIRTHRGIAIESRTGAKSMFASESTIRDAEYTARRYTITGMVVEKPVPIDCGSTVYRSVLMTELYLRNMVGKWMVTEDGSLRMIEGTEKELVGTMVKYRHVNGCRHKVRKDVCVVCAGELVNNLHYDTNLGTDFNVLLMKGISQGVLSTKHEQKSISNGNVYLGELAEHWFVSGEDNTLFVNSKRNLKGVYFIIAKTGMVRLMDVLTSSEVDIPMNNVGELSKIYIDDTNIPTMPDSVQISNSDCKANITIELLDYMRRNDGLYTLDHKGNYRIDMSQWDMSKPLFTIPHKEADVLEKLKMLSRLVEGTGRKRYHPDEHFFKLADMILAGGDFNFTAIEIIAYATTAFNESEHNMRLARNSPNPTVVPKNDLFPFRSKGQLFPYEGQGSILLKYPIETFTNPYGEGSPLDVQLMPQEMLIEHGIDGISRY